VVAYAGSGRARRARRHAGAQAAATLPCHRIIATSGALTGFSAPGGLRLKRQVLVIEQAAGFTQIALFAT
jgi:methylated-DNA-[protein]-cysteine S-methyltransferase